ncbi:MAG: mechanosensitive ion channel family protein [Candidatus Cryptobacteroides sp.]
MPLEFPPVDSLPNVPDSAKVILHNIAQTIATDPDKFIQDLLRDTISFALKVLAAFVVYMVGAWLIRRVKIILRRIFEKRKTEKTIASFVNSLVTITLTVLLIIITVGTLGVNTTSLAAVLAAGGMAIGMALSGTVQNFAGGIMILMFKPFKAGDYIEALGYSGKVSEVNIVSTKLRTFDNRTIILPNGSLSNGNINNYFEHPVNRLEWLVSVAYSTDNEKTKEVMMSILKSDPRILDASTDGAADPFVALNALKDSSVEYTMKAWVKTQDYWDVKYSINEAIYTELPKNGIDFPFPQLDVHIKN